MGRDTSIAWAHHTHNGVRGCEHATLADGTESPGCKNCYAEAGSVRFPDKLGVWGPEGTRVLAPDSYWAQLDTWHRAAVRAGELHRVFCYSLGDVFESPRNLANADVCRRGRARLWEAIERLRPQTMLPDWRPGVTERIGLIFLLLTKRPENVKRMVPSSWLVTGAPQGSRLGWPQHVWLGTSVENQQAADERIPELLAVPGVPVRFLSLEPLLGPIRFPQNWIGRVRCVFDWMIIGGEGLGKRPCDLAWIRDLRDQGREARCPVFVKQLGSAAVDAAGTRLKHPKGGDPVEWPEDLRVREVPHGW